LETYFKQALDEVNRVFKLSDEEFRLLEDADRAAEQLVQPEFERYVRREFDPEIPKILSSNGLMGIPVRKEYGGRGARHLVHSLAVERLGQVGMGVVTFVDVHQSLGSLTIQDWGNEELKQRVLPSASDGSVILAYGLTEPEAGSDPASLRTSYTKESGRYRLTGTKYLISNGSIATHIIIFAYPQGERQGMTAFLVDTKSSGFKVEMRLTEKPGLFTSDTALLSLEEVEVTKDDIVGQEGRGLHVAYSALLNGRIGIASGCLGVMEDCVKQVKERVMTRVQHGKEIGKHQLVQSHIARIVTNLESSRWLVYLAAVKREEYDSDRSNVSLRLEADRSSAVAKYVSSRAAYDAADRSVQLFGGFGYNTMSPVTKHLLDTRVARIYEGTDEILELKIASLTLGKDFEAYR
jgi:alkylation response protein AidB-like acyl-CoA dehydrogenase